MKTKPKGMTCEDAVRWHASSLAAVCSLVFFAAVAGAGANETVGWQRLGWLLSALADIVLAYVIMRTNARMCFFHGIEHGTMDSLARAFVRDVNERRREESESPDGDRP